MPKSIQLLKSLVFALLLAVSGNGVPADAADGPPAENEPAFSDEQVRFFERSVRPLLVDQCLGCHGEEKQKGDLRLDSRADMLHGGESGAAIEAGQPDASLLIEAVRYEGLEMPPDGQLDEAAIDILVRWVEMGAPWPGDLGDVKPRAPEDKISDEDRQWWAFQPLADPPVPTIAPLSGDGNPIDAFIGRQLQTVGLTPAPLADPAALIRRLSFDLIGLPPTPEEVQQFIEDPSAQAYAQLVDRLLDSPQYGERWARHWLDLVRYADSDGYRADFYRPDAWRYRDYVIDSLNADKPYDRFVQEQIAGDELFPGDPQALIATGYFRHGIYEYNSRDARGQWELILNDITDTTSDVFLGMGMQCARCHDHKFDPILQQDYYRLQAFFAALIPRDQTPIASSQQQQAFDQQQALWEAEAGEIEAEIRRIEQPYREKASAAAIGMFSEDLQAIAAKPHEQRTPYERQLYDLIDRQVLYEYERLESKLSKADKDRVLALKKQLSELQVQRPAPLPTAMTIVDVAATAPEVRIPKRGKAAVEPGFLTLLQAEPAEIEPDPSRVTTRRRSALAQWLTQPDNPLSTRVIVNRVWQYHFGRGLAPNSSDFGRLGGPPSHPELLDWLTTRFVENGWSLKWLHRQIVLSLTYRQSTIHPQSEAYQQIDPQNRHYWRGDVRRLDAEQIRDAVLAVSGKLNTQRGGPGVLSDEPRRSIYTRVMRNARDPLLDVFDLPQFFTSESSRNQTTTPVQSLLLINSPEYLQLAHALAERVSQSAASPRERLQQAWQLAMGRLPNETELEASVQFFHDHRERLQQSDTADAVDWTAASMPYRDGQAGAFEPNTQAAVPQRSDDPRLALQEMTVETFFQIRSVYESGSVRTLVAKWGANQHQPGWAWGITGKGSRRKPQTLVFHLWGKRHDGKYAEAALFSDQHVALNKPYFAAAAFQPASKDQDGSVTFYLKDLSNDEEPMQVAVVAHEIVGGLENGQPLTIASRHQSAESQFDGLIDDLRISAAVLDPQRLLTASPAPDAQTVAYWQFESQPGVLKDSSAQELDLRISSQTAGAMTPEAAALGDFCHILLNSNEFLYVH